MVLLKTTGEEPDCCDRLGMKQSLKPFADGTDLNTQCLSQSKESVWDLG